MKTSFKIYALIWAIGFAIFNLVAFVPVVSIEGAEISSSYVIATIFCDIMFFAQLGCGYFAFKPENKQKVFYQLLPCIHTRCGCLRWYGFGRLVGHRLGETREGNV